MDESVDDALALLESYVGGGGAADGATEDGGVALAPPNAPQEEEEEGEVVDEPPAKAPRTADSVSSRQAQRRGRRAPEPVPRVPCRYFMEGRCAKGDRCTYSHAVRPAVSAAEARSAEPCRFEIAGRCLKGAECLYSHDMSRVPCRFLHVRGECPSARGPGGCRFSHAPIGDAERRALFAESMGTRDPRMAAAGAGDARAEAAYVHVPRAVRVRPPDALLQRYTHALSPAVAALNPFGSPFSGLALPPM